MRALLVSVILATGLGLSACGDDGGGKGGANGGGGSGGSPSGDASASAFAGKSPEQILDEVVEALRGVRSYHVEGRVVDEDGRGSFAGDISTSGPSRLRFEQGGQRFQIVLIGADTYMRANSAFWRKQAGGSGQVVRLLADKWVRSRSRAGDLREVFDELSPRTLANCLTKEHGKLSNKGQGKVGDQETIVLHDDGNAPGGAPGDLHVAASGKPFPLRAVQTGPQRSGKSSDPKCQDDNETKESDISLSRFDEPARISAPKGAVDLDKLAPTGGQSPNEVS